MKNKDKAIFKIDTADCLSDVENMCYDARERGLFTAEQALRVLENGNGGGMWAPGVGNYGVSHIKANNEWLRKELTKKKLI
jgi:hypothetical protein